MLDGNELYSRYRQVVVPLRQLRKSYDGEITPQQASDIVVGFLRVQEGWRRFFRTGTWVYAVIGALLPGSVCIVNISSLRLTRVLQSQINAKLGHLSGLNNLNDPETGISLVVSDKDASIQGEAFSTKRRLSSNEVRELASSGTGPVRDQSLQILALQKARKDLVLVSART